MRVLWCSNSSLIASGYGVQTLLFTQMMADDDHEVIVFGFYGHHGHTMKAENMTILPMSHDQYGRDMLGMHIKHYQPDVSIVLYDAWVYDAKEINNLNLTFYAPIDHTPIPPHVVDRLQVVPHVWAMSRHGERMMRQAGIDPFYVPHAVDAQAYRPMDRQAARQKFSVSDDRLFAVMVAANKGYPSRKNFERTFKAWARFLETHPDALLYVHALPTEKHGGVDLPQCAAFYGIPPANIRFPRMYPFMRGDYDTAWMNDLYNAADVFVLPSAGEGFGVPALEAQAAGCPVILSDFTAQSELAEAGYKIPIDPFDDLLITRQGSEQANPKLSEILKGLEWAHEHRGDDKLRKAARHFALDYDIRRVYIRHAKPALQCIATMNADMRLVA